MDKKAQTSLRGISFWKVHPFLWIIIILIIISVLALFVGWLIYIYNEVLMKLFLGLGKFIKRDFI